MRRLVRDTITSPALNEYAKQSFQSGIALAEWYSHAMPLVSVDSSGRIVIPKRIREAMGLNPDIPLELVVDGEGLRLTPIRRSRRRIDVVDGLPILGQVDGPEITDADIHQLRDELER